MKKIFFCLAFVYFLMMIPFFIQSAKGEFRLGKMIFNSSFHLEWEPHGSVPTAQVQELFDHPFLYLGHGAQSFVFAAKDSPYVLKIFRHSRKMHPWRKFLRGFLKLGKQKTLTPKEKIDRLLKSAKIAFEKGADLTGLVYLHANPTKEQWLIASVKDKFGRAYRIDLNPYCFAIQKRAISFRRALEENRENREELKKMISSFVALLDERIDRKIRNYDTKVYTNFGWTGEKVVEWDFGNYLIDPEMKRNEEIERFSPTIRKFLQSAAPELLQSFEAQNGRTAS